MTVTKDVSQLLERVRVHAFQSNAVLTIDGQAVSLGSDDVDYVRSIGLTGGWALTAVSDYEVAGRVSSTEAHVDVTMVAKVTPFFDRTQPFAPLDYTINRGRDGDDTASRGTFLVARTESGRRTVQAFGDLDVAASGWERSLRQSRSRQAGR